MVCVLVLRLWNIEHPSLTYDELSDYDSSIRFANHPTVFAPISEGYLNGQLPFFCAFLLYKLLGCSETVARLLSVIVSLLSILFVFLIVRRQHGFWFGMLALVILGLSPFYLSASRLAFTHGHVFCTLPILAGLYFSQRLHSNIVSSNNSGMNRWLAGSVGVCMGLAVGSDLLACFWVVSIFLLISFWIYESSTHVIFDYLDFLTIGCFLGILVASPMYVTGFSHCARDILMRLGFWSDQTGYLWLGNVVERIPPYYYSLMFITRITPAVLVLTVITVILYFQRFQTSHPFCRALLFSLWPIVYLSVKSWKNPYYLIPFIPVLYILVVDGLRILFSMNVFKSRRYLGYLVVLSIIAGQLYTIIHMHPDYLMQGIQYSDRLYGEFQGPAVSHGQWIGEALSFIKHDCRDKQCIVYTVSNVGTPQIRHYSKEHGIPILIGEIPPRRLENNVVDKCSIYILISQDAKQMICPQHKDAIRDNRVLVSFAENSKEYKLVKTYYSGHFPMLWIYKKCAS
jgi:4-amino-4-deoxy-L-arabinose transferase-like glycosyltransferase